MNDTYLKLRVCKKTYYANICETDDNVETLTLEQSIEADNEDHWKAGINLNRWRTKTALIAYLRQIIDVIDENVNRV